MITLLILSVPAYATDELKQPLVSEDPVDTHISWHEFRHDFGSYPSVTASMDHQGVIILTGHTDNAVEKSQLQNLALKVRGATKVTNLIGTD